MSLVKKSPVSARQLAANRLNARKSTGPRTREGKENSRFNGLKHGLCAQPFRRVMSDLGEDPEEFDRFHAGLREATEPANTLEAQLVEDLAVFWWKKRRSERAQAGVQVREVERLTVERERELHDVERLTMDQPAEEAHEVGLRRAKDCRGKFEMVLDTLDTVIARLERHRGWEECAQVMRGFYGPHPTLRGAMVLNFFHRLLEGEEELPNDDDSGLPLTVAGQAAREDLEEASVDEALARAEAGDVPQQVQEASNTVSDKEDDQNDEPSDGADASEQESEASADEPEGGPEPSRTFRVRAALILYLLEERQEAAREYELFLREHVEVSDAARDACLAPTDQRWTWILRQDNYLDRQLERKIRLLDMLQEKRRKREAASQASETPAAPPLHMKMQTRSHQVVENTRRRPWEEARERPRRSAPAAGAGRGGGLAGLEKGAAGRAELACGPGG